jgi:hypothetical protein
MNYLSNVMDSFAGDVLTSLGLQRRSTAAELLVPAIGGLAVGMIVGGAAALLLAPCSGAEMRSQLNERLQTARDRAREAADTVRDRVKRNNVGAGDGPRNSTRSDA